MLGEIEPSLIRGGSHTDTRGTLSFVNGFDMSEVLRFYTIEHPSTGIQRGWRGHKIEQRWFFVSVGSFTIRVIKIDDWTNPDPKLPQLEFRLSDQQFEILHIPKGYATLLQANETNAKLLVFADSRIEDAGLDNYLFPITHFN